MRRLISLDNFESMMRMLAVMKDLGILDGVEYLVIWEKKPRLTLNRLGNFEFQNPQEVYGVTLNFWDEDGRRLGSRRFVLAERFDDEY
jgi:hypothetical protein